MLRKILHYPNPRLRLNAEKVLKVTPEIQTLVDDMFETMYESHGIGLAATQIDIQQQVVTIDLSENQKSPLVLMNPIILEKSGETEHEEGCLSFPGIFEKVKRAAQVKVSALDRDGKSFELAADGLLAICIQHEIDHLMGKVFIDYLSPLKRQLIRKKMHKLEKMVL